MNALLNSKKPLTTKFVDTYLIRATDGSVEFLDKIKDYLAFKKNQIFNYPKKE